MAVPEELRELLMNEVRECRERISEIMDSESTSLIEESKLDTYRQRISECRNQLAYMEPKQRDFSDMQGQDYSDYWASKHEFYDAVNGIEKGVLGNLFRRLERDPAEVKTLDLGIGTGRSSKIAMDAVKSMEGVDEKTLQAFAKGVHGLELDPGNLKLSRQNLAALGVPAENIRQGNFMAPFPEDMRGKFDVVWMMMNGMTYANTEDRAMDTVQNIEASLAPGGIFLFDMVQLDSLQRMPSERDLAGQYDLMNFHSNLARMYNAENHHGVGFPQSRRFHVTGSTAVIGSPEMDQTRHPDNGILIGGNAYPREIYTMDYFNHILQKSGSRLKTMGLPIDKPLPPLDPRIASAIGMRWMQQNGMEPYLRAEIAHRLAQDGGEPRPFYDQPHVFRRPKEAHELLLELGSEEVTNVLRQQVAPGMVNTYTKEYCFYRKEA